MFKVNISKEIEDRYGRHCTTPPIGWPWNITFARSVVEIFAQLEIR